MIISNTSHNLYVVLGSTPTTELNVLCSYELITSTESTPVEVLTLTDRTNEVTITGDLGADEQLKIENLVITNVNNDAIETTVGIYDGTDYWPLYSTQLNGGEVLQYTKQNGFQVVGQNSVLDVVLIQDSTTNPSIVAGYSNIYSMSLAGKSIPKFGADDYVQNALFMRPTMWFLGSSTTGSGNEGGTNTGSGGFPTPSTSTVYTSYMRTTFGSVVTTTNQTVGRRTPNVFLRGASAGQGGFFAVCIFGFETWTAGDRLFVGFSNTGASLLTGQPSALIDIAGFGIDAGDTAITFMHNDNSGTATKDTIAGQPTLASSNMYRAFIRAYANDTVIYWQLDNMLTNTKIADGFINSDMPRNNLSYYFQCVMGNAANTTANNAQLAISQYYIAL